jgi:hypothetical protein
MADDILVAHYATRGGKYQIKAFECRMRGNAYYRIEYLTNNKADGASTGLSSLELGIALARSIFFAKRCDKINYAPIKEWPETTRILNGETAATQETAAQ